MLSSKTTTYLTEPGSDRGQKRTFPEKENILLDFLDSKAAFSMLL